MCLFDSGQGMYDFDTIDGREKGFLSFLAGGGFDSNR